MALGSTQSLVKMSTGNIPGCKGGWCVRLTTSPPSCAECHEIWEPKPPGTPWATPGLLRDSFTFTFTHFCMRLSTPQGHSASGRIMPTKNCNDIIGNQTHDLPAWSIVPQPTVPLHAPRTCNKDKYGSELTASCQNKIKIKKIKTPPPNTHWTEQVCITAILGSTENKKISTPAEKWNVVIVNFTLRQCQMSKNFWCYLCMLLVCSIHNRSTTDFSHFLAMTIKTPTTNFAWPYDILNKKNSTTKSQRQLVKQLNVLE